jgi:hypothetical protein
MRNTCAIHARARGLRVSSCFCTSMVCMRMYSRVRTVEHARAQRLAIVLACWSRYQPIR